MGVDWLTIDYLHYYTFDFRSVQSYFCSMLLQLLRACTNVLGKADDGRRNELEHYQLRQYDIKFD